MGGRTIQPGRLRRRLTIAFVLVAGVSAGALAIGSDVLVSRARFDDSLARAAGDVRYQIILAQQFLPLDGGRSASLLASFASSGREVILVPDGGDADVPSAAVRARAQGGDIVFERVAGHRLVVGGLIPGSGAQLYVVYAEDRIHADLAQLRTVLLAGWIGVVLCAALIGHVLARRTLEPVGRASEAARAVAEGLLATRLPVHARDEFGAWAESFNRMADALQAKIARERRFTADVAHELRTPVTALVAAASLLREHLGALPGEAQRPAELLVADVVRLRHLVGELMEISRLDAGQEAVSVRPTDVLAVVREIAAPRGVQVIGAPVVLDTDPRRLERIVANLIANACEHGRPPVVVTVSGDGVVTVADRGPGIEPHHLPRLFERFYKADPARSGPGSGLGLAIALENARLLGAELNVRSEAGFGTEFRLALPVTQRLPDGEAGVEDGVERDTP